MTKLRSKLKPIDMQVSIAIATVSLIILILLLAYSVKHAREQDRVRQFGERHAAIARTAAAGIEDTIASVRESLIVFSNFVSIERDDPEALQKSIKYLQESMMRQVRIVAMTDVDGRIIAMWPTHAGVHHVDTAYWMDYIRKFGHLRELPSTFIRLVRLRETAGYAESAILIHVPHYNEYGHYRGTVIALLSLDAVLDRYAGPLREGGSVENWFFGHDGTIIVHSNPYMTGKKPETLLGDSEDAVRWREFILSDTAGYGNFIIRDARGVPERMLVAVAPIVVDGARFTIALVTPYDEVVELMREVFLNFTVGVVGLIILLILAAMAVGYIVTKQARWEEIRKRLAEREEWQNRIIREKMTIEGIIEGSPIPTMVIDRDHKVMFWNKALAELTGYDSKEMVGTDRHYLAIYKKKRPLIADIIVEGDLEKLENYYGRKQIQKSKTVRDAYEAYDFFEDMGGKGRHLYFLAAPIYDEKGDITAAIETLQDITREKDLEKSLKEYAETLQNELESNIRLRKEIEGLYAYLQSIIEALPEKIYDINEEGIITYVSRESFTGRGPAKGTHFLDFVDPENRDFVQEKWEDGKRGIFTPYQLEVTARDGSKRYVLITPRPIPGTRHVLLVQQDITKIRKLQKTIFDNEKLAALGQLSAGIAHELRNALSSIKMSLQILERRLEPTGNDLKRFRIAQREVEHLSQLVRDVLLYAKPAEPEKEHTALESVIEHSLAMVERELADKHIVVEKNYESELPPVEVDPGMLAQAIVNLLLNAIDAVDDGGKLSISTGPAKDDPRMVFVEITDNGCGIEEEHISSLFNPFFSRKKYGTGLGLAQVKKIVDVHNGGIEVFSKPGEGTRVVITLPISDK